MLFLHRAKTQTNFLLLRKVEMKKLISSLVVVGAMIASPFAESNPPVSLFEQSATVSLNVELYATISGLEDFVLTTTSSPGEAGAVYSGTGTYHLESNGQIQVSLDGDNLSNGVDSIPTTYALDSSYDLGSDGSGVTSIDEAHNAEHFVSVEATLGDISAQKAGTYSSVITLTVTAPL